MKKYAISCLLIFAIVAGCKKPEFDAIPEVSPQFIVPVAKGKIIMSEYFTPPDSTISVDSITKQYKISIKNDLPINFNFDTLVKIPDVAPTPFKFKFDKFTVPDQNPNPAVFTMADFNFPSSGTVPFIPAVAGKTAENPISLGNNVDYIILDDGDLNLHIVNDFQFPITITTTIQNDTLTFSDVLATNTSTVNPGETKDVSLDLAGKTARGKLKMIVDLSSPGKNSSTTVTVNDQLSITLSLKNLTAQSGRAKIDVSANDTTRVDTIRIGGLGNGAILDEILFKGGTMDFSVLGNAGILDLDVSSSDIILANSSNFSMTESGFNSTMDGMKFKFHTTGTDSNYCVVTTTTAVKTDAQGYVIFNAGDSIQFSPAITGAKFKRVGGYMGSKLISVNQKQPVIDSTADFLKRLSPNKIALKDVQAKLIMSSSVGIPIGIDMELKAFSNFGSSYDVLDTIIDQIQKGGENASQTAPVIKDVSITLPSSVLEKLISSIPKQIQANATLEVNKGITPNQNAGNFVYDSSAVKAAMEIIAPLSVVISSLSYPDTSKLSNGSFEEIDGIKNVSGYLEMHVKNSFPIEMKMDVKLVDSTNAWNVLSSLTLAGSDVLQKAATDPVTGRVTTATYSRLKFPVDLNVYKNLSKATHIMVTATVDTKGDVAKFFSDSGLEYSIISSVKVTYDKDE